MIDVLIGRREETGKWVVYTMHGGMMNVLGEFDSKEHAKVARQQWEAKMAEYPEHEDYQGMHSECLTPYSPYKEPPRDESLPKEVHAVITHGDNLLVAVEACGNSPLLAQAKSHVERAILLSLKHYVTNGR